jgi:serine/threonine protein kinase
MYLAPELLAEKAIFVKNTDVWGLGCILYELVTLKNAFSGYGMIREYAATGGKGLDIPLIPFAKADAIFLVDLIYQLLAPDPKQRPSASTILENVVHPGPARLDIASGKHNWILNEDNCLVHVRPLWMKNPDRQLHQASFTQLRIESIR